MTMARIGNWAAEVAAAGEPVIAVSHKAAIRALLALATGWDMTGRQPVKLDWRCLHFFAAHGDGKVSIERLNVAMEAA
jgi:probable phosphoglycerate mutase